MDSTVKLASETVKTKMSPCFDIFALRYLVASSVLYEMIVDLTIPECHRWHTPDAHYV